MVVYATMMVEHEEKQNLIDSMAFFENFGDIEKYLNDIGVLKRPVKFEDLNYHDMTKQKFRKEMRMGANWHGLSYKGKFICYWTNINIACGECTRIATSKKYAQLMISERISKEECFRGVVNLFPPSPIKRTYRIDFTVDTGVDWREFFVIMTVAGEDEVALEKFHKWIYANLRGGESVVDQYTKVSEMNIQQGVEYTIIAQNAFTENERLGNKL